MEAINLLLHVGVRWDGGQPRRGLGGPTAGLFGALKGGDVTSQHGEGLDEILRGRLVGPHPALDQAFEVGVSTPGLSYGDLGMPPWGRPNREIVH